MKQPIFILGAHKSGTSLLRSMFDGHERLFVAPVEDHLFKHLGFQIRYPYQYQPKQDLKPQDVKKNFIKWINEVTKANDKYADSIVGESINTKTFKKYIKEHNIESTLLEELINLYFNALYFSIYNSELREKRVVTKSVENSEFALELQSMYPDAKFIHIVRNPYASFVALRKYKAKNGRYPLIFKLVEALKNDFYFLQKNKAIIKTNYKVIRYEDLVENPEKVILDLTEFLNIRHSKHLLEPTFLGKPWSGNSTSDNVFNTLDKRPLKNWIDDIYAYEVFVINSMFSTFMKSMNYEKIKPKKSIYYPSKGEGIFKYVLNRSFKYYLPFKS